MFHHVLIALLVIGSFGNDLIPRGAEELGYNCLVFDVNPKRGEISAGSRSKWVSGLWYQKDVPSLDLYSDVEGGLGIDVGGVIVSADRDMRVGLLPLLPGRTGFYVEVTARLSSNDSDHWPAIWMMPIEHNGRNEDQYDRAKEGYQQWMELDIDEGGFGPGMTGSVHSWYGVWTGPGSYRRQSNDNHISREPLDRVLSNTFGASFDPIELKVSWWLNGDKKMVAGYPAVPEVARRQNFYLILSANTHGKNVAYKLIVERVRAFGRSDLDSFGDPICPDASDLSR